MGLLDGMVNMETIKPMLIKHMAKEKIESIIVSKNGEEIEIKNYSINVINAFAEVKKEIDENRAKIDIAEIAMKQKNELIESIINVVNSRKSDTNKVKELNKILG